MSKDKVTLVAMMMTFTFLALGNFAFTLLLSLLSGICAAEEQQ